MGEKNSSLTRVQPLFNELLDTRPDSDVWLDELWDMASLAQPGASTRRRRSCGSLSPTETPATRASRIGKVFERTVAPPADFLRWLLMHPERMQVRDPVTFGAKSDEARRWRAKLFSGDPAQVAEAQNEGLRQLGARLAQRGRNKWWAFEGFTHVDCCLITDQCVIFVEGKRTESVSPSTLWFSQRSQLWRNVEAAKEFAREKDYAVILAVENAAEGTAALIDAAASLEKSYPHLNVAERTELASRLIGFVTWADVVKRFGLPETCLPDTVG